MQFTKADLFYTDYRWNSGAQYKHARIIIDTDHTELHRTEGYEMLHFITSLAKTWNWPDTSLKPCQRLERIIREAVPATIKTHAGIKEWIASNYARL